MRKILKFCRTRPKQIILFNILLTVFFAWSLTKIRFNPSVEIIAVSKQKTDQLIKKYAPNLDRKWSFFLAVRSKDLFDVKKLRVFEKVIHDVEKLPWVTGSTNPFNSLTLEVGDEKKVRLLPLSPHFRAPRNKEELAEFKKNLENDFLGGKLLYSPKEQALAVVFTDNPGEGKTYSKKQLELYYKTIAPLNPYFDKVYTGGDFLFQSLSSIFLSRDLFRLLGGALFLLLLVLYWGLRSVRGMLLPLVVVGTGTVWSLGLSRLLGLEITLISVSIPPMVLAIGSSYAVHILSQYFREAPLHQDDKNSDWLTEAIIHVQKTIFMASLTTLIGFSGLLATSTPAARAFGIMAGLGILSCALLSFFFLPAVLSLMPLPSGGHVKRIRRGRAPRLMGAVGYWVYRHYRIVLLISLGLSVAAIAAYPHISFKSDFTRYFPKNIREVRDLGFIIKNFGGVQTLNLTLTAPENRRNYFLRPEVQKKVTALEEHLKKNPNIGEITSFTSYARLLQRHLDPEVREPGRGVLIYIAKQLRWAETRNVFPKNTPELLSPDGSRMTIIFRIRPNPGDLALDLVSLKTLVDEVKKSSSVFLPEGITAEVWDPVLRFLDIPEIVSRDQMVSTLLALGLILILTTLFFRSFIYGLVTMIPIVMGIVANVLLMVLLKIPLDVVTMMTTSIIIGVGIDDSIHYLLQFVQQYEQSKRIDLAVAQTGKISGLPIVLTTFSIMAGLIILTLARFKGIVYFGFLLSVSLLATMLSTLLIIPAVIPFLYRRGLLPGARTESRYPG